MQLPASRAASRLASPTHPTDGCRQQAAAQRQQFECMRLGSCWRSGNAFKEKVDKKTAWTFKRPYFKGWCGNKNNEIAFEHQYSVLIVVDLIPLGGGVGLKMVVTRRSDFLQSARWMGHTPTHKTPNGQNFTFLITVQLHTGSKLERLFAIL